MNQKVSSFSGLAIAAFVIAVLVSGGQIGKALAQNVSSNQTTNQSSTMNQTTPQAANQTAANQTATKQPKLTTSDIQDIRKSLEDIRKSIADGKAVDALKSINDVDQKLLVAMSANPPPMLEKSSEGNK
jgi:hypothetical protein